MKNYESHDKAKDKQVVNVNLLNGDSANKIENKLQDECVSDILEYPHNLDFKSQSLPDCTNKDEIYLDLSLDEYDHKSQNEDNSPSPKSESWFKSFRTWPERYEKLKNVDTQSSTSKSPTKNTNTQELSNCDQVDNSNIKNKLSFNEALQNISLAYSPITKQLHLVDTTKTDTKNYKDFSNNEGYVKKSGHRRTEAGSFSSTISSLSAISDQSTSGSLIGSEERSLSSLDISNFKPRRKSLTNFFSKHIFTWKGASTEPTPGTSVWKIFSKQPNDDSAPVSPIHVVASSSALIQHERPSSLPAKSQKEEQKHKDEYKAILAAAKKKEAQSSAAKQKQQKLQLKLEEQQAFATKHFTQNVLPHWNSIKTPIRDLS
ncbi:unnamed protein product [Psylliodes chrysocephalus]|uniref:Uncharacterized protein n=1 Tax=Psylliodes chrysocephalus TaxID=3402493 RepID=A0A9P0DAI1_9CUCU|nr:unnamed protein product [Psylliodes chrysocephala]